MDDVRDEMQTADEIGIALSQPMGDGYDDSALEAEVFFIFSFPNQALTMDASSQLDDLAVDDVERRPSTMSQTPGRLAEPVAEHRHGTTRDEFSHVSIHLFACLDVRNNDESPRSEEIGLRAGLLRRRRT